MLRGNCENKLIPRRKARFEHRRTRKITAFCVRFRDAPSRNRTLIRCGQVRADSMGIAGGGKLDGYACGCHRSLPSFASRDLRHAPYTGLLPAAGRESGVVIIRCRP